MQRIFLILVLSCSLLVFSGGVSSVRAAGPLGWLELDIFPGAHMEGLLQLLDRAVGFGTTLGVRLGPLDASDLGRMARALLAMDRLRLVALPSAGGMELELQMHFREGRPAQDALPPLLETLRPWLREENGRLQAVPVGIWPAASGWSGEARLESAGHDAGVRAQLCFETEGLRPLGTAEVSELAERSGDQGFFRWQLGLDWHSKVMGRLPLAWVGGSLGFSEEKLLQCFACVRLHEGTLAVELERWLNAWEGADSGENAPPAEYLPAVGLLAALQLPDFDVFPRRSGPAQAFWALGLSPRDDLEPVLEPRVRLLMRFDAGLIPFFGQPDPPEFLLLFARKPQATPLLPLLVERVDALIGSGTTEVRGNAEDRLAVRILPGFWGRDLDFVIRETEGHFAIGHGRDLARACFTGDTGETEDVGAGMFRGDENLLFYLDVQRAGDWLKAVAAREWGRFDLRTLDLTRSLNKLSAVSLTARARGRGIELRAAIRGK